MNPTLLRAWLITTHAPAEIALKYSSIRPEDLVIAVDGGFARCLQLGIKPQMVLGDFDSLEPDLKARIPKNCRIISYDSDKNETDTQLALLHCIREGVMEVYICNDLEGRFDHSLALIQNLGQAQVSGIKAYIVSDKVIIYLIEKDTELNYPAGTRLSVLSATPEVAFTYSAGLKYPLDNLTLVNWNARGISNEVTQNSQFIGIESGTALLVVTLA